MSRISTTFDRLGREGRCGLITYLAAGDPSPEATVPLLQTLVAAGADILEVGVPFSDPMADGPIIQRSSDRALAGGMTLRRVLEEVRRFRSQDQSTPVVLMGYLNPIEAMGYGEFASAAAAAGVDGVLIVDLPPEEADDVNAALTANALDEVYLVAPTSSAERVKGVGGNGGGFIYYVSVTGVTGQKAPEISDVQAHVEAFRAAVALPVGVGFGIKDATTAAAMAAVGDAVVVGSALVEIVERHGADLDQARAELGRFTGELRDAIDHARQHAMEEAASVTS